MTATLARRCDPWQVAAAVAGLGPGTPPRPLRMPDCRRLVVVVAHPYEELGAAGGLLHDLALQGVPVSVLVVTDSGAPHLDASYHALGLSGIRRYRLGLAGGRVEAAEHDVTAAVSELVGFGDPRGLWCLAPWELDGHPDHDAVGRATAAACTGYRLPLLRYPITAADRIRSSAPADHQVHQLALTAPVRRRKRRALMRLRVGGLTGDVEQVAPTEVFAGHLAPEGGSSREAGSRRPAATAPRREA